MEVYRITLAKYANSLQASGNPARWNSKNVRLIYTAQSRSLACLENVVHRTAIGLTDQFRTMVIEIPDDISIKSITEAELKKGWHQFENQVLTQSIGDKWIADKSSVVLRVPSAIINGEFNFLINPFHEDFSRIRILAAEEFNFDPRKKNIS